MVPTENCQLTQWKGLEYVHMGRILCRFSVLILRAGNMQRITILANLNHTPWNKSA